VKTSGINFGAAALSLGLFFATETTLREHSNNKLGDHSLGAPHGPIYRPCSAVRCICIAVESVMSEVEFDRMLEAVRLVIAPGSEEDFLAQPSNFIELPKAVNDNQSAWQFIPFPEGWSAV
jgi:hypothetical protein